MAIQEFYLGLDLCQEYTQLSYYNTETNEPESIYQLNTNDTYMLPNIVFYSNEDLCWYVGAEAPKHRFNQQGILIEDVVKKLPSSESIVLDENTYTYKDLFLLLMKGHIYEFLNRYENSKISKLVITVYEYREDIYEALEELYEVLDIEPDKIEVTSRINSYIHYVFNQPAELRNNSVVLFDYSIYGLDFYRIDVENRGGRPAIIDVIHRDFRRELTYDMVFGDRQKLDNAFAGLADKELKEKYVSSVYLTGIGFGDKWLKNSTNVICSGRRVFMGQNIYTKGACYAAYSGHSVIEPGKYTVRTEDTVIYDVGIAVKGDNSGFHVISYGGQEWYNMNGSIEIFLNDTNRIIMTYKNRIDDSFYKEVIEIHGLPKRPDKTTKLSLEVEFYSNAEGALIIRDVGFGKLYPTTNKIYRKEFTIRK